MDGLISVLIIIGISIFTSSRKKKKAAQKQAAPSPKASRSAKQTAIPFTKEEWSAYLAGLEGKKSPPAPARKAPEASKPKQPAPALRLEHDEPEGTVSTQGETAAEHARHRMKVLAEEKQRAERQESLQELRHLNREKLRSAVVMSEILGKPVSLRPRGYR